MEGKESKKQKIKEKTLIMEGKEKDLKKEGKEKTVRKWIEKRK